MVTFEQVYERNREIANASPDLWDYTEKLILKARTRGILPSRDETPLL